MNIVVYYKPESKTGSRLRTILETLTYIRMRFSTSILEFEETLSRPGMGWGISVIQAGSFEELRELVSMVDRLRDFRVILILPDSRPNTLTTGHLLYPRIVFFPEDDLCIVEKVIRKMSRHFIK